MGELVLGYRMLLRALIICFAIAVAETLHGAMRVFLLNPRLGDRHARQVGVFTGSLVFFVITWLSLPWINPVNITQCLWIGLLWTGLMLGFDIAFGRLYFRFSWKRLLADFDVRQGGLLGLGMFLLLIAPTAVAKLRRMF